MINLSKNIHGRKRKKHNHDLDGIWEKILGDLKPNLTPISKINPSHLQ